MAYKVQYMLLADQIQQVDRGKFNILGAFDQIVAPELPTRYANFVVVALLVALTEDELGEHDVSLRIERPTGQVVGETGARMRINPLPGTWVLTSAIVVIGVGNLPITEHGRHWLRLVVDGKPVAEHPLMVVGALALPPPAAR